MEHVSQHLDYKPVSYNTFQVIVHCLYLSGVWISLEQRAVSKLSAVCIVCNIFAKFRNGWHFHWILETCNTTVISIAGRSPHINSQYTTSDLMIYFITNRITQILTYRLRSTQHTAWNMLTKLVDWLPEQLYHLEHLVVPVYTNTSRHRHHQGLQQSLAETEFWYEGRNWN